MSPVLSDGDIVVSLKSAEFQQGDIVAFCHNNKILVKRVIALACVVVFCTTYALILPALTVEHTQVLDRPVSGGIYTYEDDALAVEVTLAAGRRRPGTRSWPSGPSPARPP